MIYAACGFIDVTYMACIFLQANPQACDIWYYKQTWQDGKRLKIGIELVA